MRFKTERLKDPAVKPVFRAQMTAKMEEFFGSFVRMAELPQSRIDSLDKQLCLKIKSVAKDVLGVGASCKFKTYSPLTSDHLSSLESQQVENPNANLNKEIAAEMGKIRRERFHNFTMDMDRKAPGETLKVVSQVMRNRGRQTFALSNSEEGMDRAADYFESMSSNTLPQGEVPETTRRAEGTTRIENAASIFTQERYQDIIDEMSLTTAPGNSLVSNVMVKEGGEALMDQITDLPCPKEGGSEQN
jgi:hypothetical protein